VYKVHLQSSYLYKYTQYYSNSMSASIREKEKKHYYLPNALATLVIL